MRNWHGYGFSYCQQLPFEGGFRNVQNACELKNATQDATIRLGRKGRGSRSIVNAIVLTSEAHLLPGLAWLGFDYLQGYHKDVLTKKIKEHQVPPPPPPTPEDEGVPEELEELRREEEMLGLPLSPSATSSDSDLSRPSEGSVEESSRENERRNDSDGVLSGSSSSNDDDMRDSDRSSEDTGDQTRSPLVLRGSSSSSGSGSDRQSSRLATVANTAEESAQ